MSCSYSCADSMRLPVCMCLFARFGSLFCGCAVVLSRSLDDVMVVQMTDPPPPSQSFNFIVNGGFEELQTTQSAPQVQAGPQATPHSFITISFCLEFNNFVSSDLAPFFLS